MKLQISFDKIDLEQTVSIAQKVATYADVLEIGSLLLFQYGVSAIKAFREAFPDITLLADTKIVDRGRDATRIFTQAKTDWVTVMAGTQQEVIHACCSKAHESGAKVMLDLLDSNSPGQSALDAKSLGVDAILFHQTQDDRSTTTFSEKWNMVQGNTKLPIYISGSINRENIDAVAALNPSGIIVGSAIISSNDPVVEAQFFKEKCNN